MDSTTLLILLFSLVAIYLLMGLTFCVTLFIRGLCKLDPGTRGAGLGFKLIIIPGILAFWPFLLKALIKRRS